MCCRLFRPLSLLVALVLLSISPATWAEEPPPEEVPTVDPLLTEGEAQPTEQAPPGLSDEPVADMDHQDVDIVKLPGSEEGWSDPLEPAKPSSLRIPPVKLGGFIQAWVIPYLGEDHTLVANYDPADYLGFRLRRARLTADGEPTAWSSFELALDLRDGVTEGDTLYTGVIGFHLAEEANLMLGVQSVPFIYSDSGSSQELQFPDLPISSQLLSDTREMGVSIQGTLIDLISYNVGVFNGSKRFTKGNADPGLMVAGRLEAHPFGPMGYDPVDFHRSDLRVALGVGALYNDSHTVTRNGMAADLRLKIKGLSLAGAFLTDTRTPVARPINTGALPSEVRRHGWHAQAGYMIWGPYLEIAARVDTMDDNMDLGDQGDVRLFTMGINVYNGSHGLKGMLHYTHRQELKGPSFSNDAVVLAVQASL